jgi:prevent-host-death family protein
MKTLELEDATAPLAEYARHADQETVIVTVNGKPVAALIGMENTDLETATLSTDPQFIALIEHARTRQQAEGGASSAEIRKRLGMI